MYRHFLAVFLLSTAQLSLAENAEWDCEKNEAGEWSCSGDSPSVSKKTIVSPSKKNVSETHAVEQNVFEPPVSDIKSVAEEIVVLPVKETQTLTSEFSKPLEIVPIPPQNVASKLDDGWSCTPNAADGTWDCALVGANPEGEVRVVTNTEEDEWGLLDRTFNSQQERVFNNLLRDFPQDPWAQCDSRRPQKIDLRNNKKAFREEMPLDIYSDYSEIFDKEVANFIGNVKMTRADQHLTADRANFNTASNMLDTQGNVYYSEQGLSLFSHSASLRFADNNSVLRDVLFIAGDAPIRGSAKVAYRDSKELSHYKEATYTSCRPGNQDWVIHADHLKMNKESGLGSATNAWLEFKGIPVLYTPYINFPIDNRRASGFLAPSWGTTDENGFDVAMPFYWNIAPDYDMTLTPRYLGKRGGILGVDFRHLSQISESSIGIEYMPEDYLREEARFHGVLKNRTVITPELIVDVDLNYVSDDDYFDELGNALSVSDKRHLKSRADLRYQTDNVDFLTRFENYQTIDRTIASADLPYQKLPQIQLNLKHSFNEMPIDLGMENEFVYFYRSNRVNGQRINLKPSIAFPYNTASAFVTPKLALQYTQYFLENRTQGSTDSLSRILPIASVDSGLFFERELQFADSSLLHTIEPRAYYLYIPYSNQGALPIFDSSLNDFTFNSLFRENRFSGSDRIQDTNQFTVALTTRLIDANSGVEHLKLAVGEVFYFKNRRVTLPNDPIETRSLSNLVGELSGRLNENWSFSTGAQWDPDINDVTRGFANLHYVNKAEQIANIGYRYRKGELVQSDISFRWPIYDNWYAVGRWQYSLKFNTTKESFVGIEKESCCWRFRIIGRRYVNSISDASEAETQTGVFVQLELKGLTSIGDNVEEFLEKNISGYEKPL